MGDKKTSESMTGLFPFRWDHQTIDDCLRRQCLPNGKRTCSICRREQPADARVRFLAFDTETGLFLFLFCQECNESDKKLDFFVQLRNGNNRSVAGTKVYG